MKQTIFREVCSYDIACYPLSMFNTEAAVDRYSSKEVFLTISQFSQKNTCVGFNQKEAPVQVVSWGYCNIFKNSFFYRTPLVDASVNTNFEYK